MFQKLKLKAKDLMFKLHINIPVKKYLCLANTSTHSNSLTHLHIHSLRYNAWREKNLIKFCLILLPICVSYDPI